MSAVPASGMMRVEGDGKVVPIRQIAVLAEQLETPFYVLDLRRVAARLDRFAAAWRAEFPEVTIAYSYKTNPLKAVTRCVRERGAAAEVVSGCELEWALEDGHLPERIYFDGPVKTDAELRRALTLGATVHVDSIAEARRIRALLNEEESRSRLALRVSTPARDGWSRFGLLGDEIAAAARELAACSRPVSGLHLHIGSNVLDTTAHARVISHYASLIRLLVRRCPSPRFTLDIGGGYAATSAGREPPSDGEYAANVRRAVTQADIPLDRLDLVLEPGRCLVEDYGWLVSRVSVRKVRAGRNVLVLDAGGNLLRSASSWFHSVTFLPVANGVSTSYDIYGANCFERDSIALDVNGPDGVAAGAIVVVGSAGGYDLPSANAWTRPLAPVIALEGPGWFEARARSTAQQLRERELEVPSALSFRGVA